MQLQKFILENNINKIKLNENLYLISSIDLLINNLIERNIGDYTLKYELLGKVFSTGKGGFIYFDPKLIILVKCIDNKTNKSLWCRAFVKNVKKDIKYENGYKIIERVKNFSTREKIFFILKNSYTTNKIPNTEFLKEFVIFTSGLYSYIENDIEISAKENKIIKQELKKVMINVKNNIKIFKRLIK